MKFDPLIFLILVLTRIFVLPMWCIRSISWQSQDVIEFLIIKTVFRLEICGLFKKVISYLLKFLLLGNIYCHIRRLAICLENLCSMDRRCVIILCLCKQYEKPILHSTDTSWQSHRYFTSAITLWPLML